jgi:transposase
MNAVGIDISKGKSMIAVMRPAGEVLQKPFEVIHDEISLKELSTKILSYGEDTRVIMEATGRYHEPVAKILHEAGIFVCVLNPVVIKQSGAGSVRKVKTDKKDALKIAKYGIDNWRDLRQYNLMDTTRQQLKLFSRQYNLHMKTVTALQNNLISLLDAAYPNVNRLFSSPARDDGSQKWVDFAMHFWHADLVAKVKFETFADRYLKWCKRNGYKFSLTKAELIHSTSRGLFATLPKSNETKLLITSAISALNQAMKVRAAVKLEVIRQASLLPEYEAVSALYGVGEITAAQLMAELGDVRQFNNRGAIVAFAGVDPEVNQSGLQNRISNKASKRGSPHLRKTLFQVVSTYLKRSPLDEPVYQFLDKKRKEGKPYYVYMTAGANKFLRIYHARIKEHLNSLDESHLVQ